MKKRHALILTFLIIAGGALLMFLNSNYRYSKKLILAIREENITAVKEIIEAKPSCINAYPSVTPKWWHSAFNVRVCFPLNEACSTGNESLVKLLLANGADPNCNDGLTPLSITYSNKAETWYTISHELIENGASIDYITEYSCGMLSVFQDIVNAPNGVVLPEDQRINNAFSFALENCNQSKVSWMRVLQHSISNSRISIVKQLLDNRLCDVNDTSLGMTALMFAARDSTPEMVQLLLDYGADRNISSPDGRTAYDYAVNANNTCVIKMLSEHKEANTEESSMCCHGS